MNGTGLAYEFASENTVVVRRAQESADGHGGGDAKPEVEEAEEEEEEPVGTLERIRRMILERIAGRASKFYLYELLADIARETGDTEASFVALENSLAEAGLRRPAVLRELVTLATPNTVGPEFPAGGNTEAQRRGNARVSRPLRLAGAGIAAELAGGRRGVRSCGDGVEGVVRDGAPPRARSCGR